MTIIKSQINHDKCLLSINCQNMEYNFTFSLDRFNLQKVQEIVQKFRSLAQSIENYQGGNDEDDEYQKPSNVIFVSHTSQYNHFFSMIEHLCEDDYSLGHLRFEQRIDIAEYANFFESNFFIEITEENRQSIVSDLQRISNEIEGYMRRESRHLSFGFVPQHQSMYQSPTPSVQQSMYQSPTPSVPQQPSSPIANRQMSTSSMYQSPTPSVPQQPSAPIANRQMHTQPMTPQQLFGHVQASPQASPQVYRSPVVTPQAPQQPSAPFFNRYPQGNF